MGIFLWTAQDAPEAAPEPVTVIVDRCIVVNGACVGDTWIRKGSTYKRDTSVSLNCCASEENYTSRELRNCYARTSSRVYLCTMSSKQ